MYNAFADDWQTNLCQFFKFSIKLSGHCDGGKRVGESAELFIFLQCVDLT
jgi:hypothetical protein